ncbi:hypothetical protein ACFXPK_05900, partial [Streptomyces sp. NPDC059142]
MTSKTSSSPSPSPAPGPEEPGKSGLRAGNCAECGTRPDPGESFCDGCGAVLNWTPQAASGRSTGTASTGTAASGASASSGSSGSSGAWAGERMGAARGRRPPRARAAGRRHPRE